MKIALVHRHYPMLGGVTTVVDYLKKELEKENKLEVITNIPNVGEKNIKYISGNRFTFYLKVYRYLKKNKFDVIHTQSFPLCYFSPLLKNKVIFSVQGYDKIYSWPKNNYLKIIVFLTTWGRILGYKFTRKIIAVSNIIKDNLVDKHKVPLKKIAIIHNGVKTKMFKPLRRRKNKNLTIFLYGSNHRKGFDKLIKWAPELIKEIKNIKFIIVGKKKKLPREIKNYFEFYEDVPFKEMPKIFNMADLVILPSINEPFGITAAEGMSCGKATIVSRVAGVADIINNGKDGIISSFKDFPKNIISLAKNSKKRKEMGRRAREKIIKKLSSKVLAKKHLELYKEISKSF